MILKSSLICQSVSWPISIDISDQYMDISRTVWDIFLNVLETFLGCLYALSKWFWISCMSVNLLVDYFPNEISSIKRYPQFWMRYISENFEWPFCNIFTLNFFYSLISCMPISLLIWLTLLLKIANVRIFPVLDEISTILGHIPVMYIHLFQIILIYLYACQSVS